LEKVPGVFIDMVHFNAAGHEIVAKLIEKLLKDQRVTSSGSASSSENITVPLRHRAGKFDAQHENNKNPSQLFGPTERL
jgi:hypothetical protein